MPSDYDERHGTDLTSLLRSSSTLATNSAPSMGGRVYVTNKSLDHTFSEGLTGCDESNDRYE